MFSNSATFCRGAAVGKQTIFTRVGDTGTEKWLGYGGKGVEGKESGGEREWRGKGVRSIVGLNIVIKR